MIASKLTFNSEMLEALSSPMLTPKKKRDLRKRRVIDYIKAHEGEDIHIATLIREAGYNPRYIEGDDSYKNGWALIENMVKSKLIYREKGKVRGFARYRATRWARPLLPTTSTIASGTAKNIPHDKPAGIKGLVMEIPVDYERNIPKYEIFIDKAKKFAWDNNSDSLRDFIKTL